MLISVQTFNNLFHGFPAGFAKISDLALLNGMFHAAKHPLVPEGTPVPGFERPTLHQMTSQDIASGKKKSDFFSLTSSHISVSKLSLVKAEKMTHFHLTCYVCFVLSCFSALEYTDGRSFMEDLNEAPETIEELFNGRPHLGFEQSGTCCLFR